MILSSRIIIQIILMECPNKISTGSIFNTTPKGPNSSTTLLHSGLEPKKISTKEVFHHSRWKLDWNNSKFDLLGITFSVNLKEMLELNYMKKLEDIRKIINKWSMRKLSPIGRLTIIKTLIIPKLNHLYLSKEISNAFWKEVLDSWIRLININKESKLVLSEHIWNNPHN